MQKKITVLEKKNENLIQEKKIFEELNESLLQQMKKMELDLEDIRVKC